MQLSAPTSFRFSSAASITSVKPFNAVTQPITATRVTFGEDGRPFKALVLGAFAMLALVTCNGIAKHCNSVANRQKIHNSEINDEKKWRKETEATGTKAGDPIY